MPQINKLALITGANSGIGFEAARELARAGASVILACRSQARGDSARARIVAEIPGAQVEVLPLDLASLGSIQTAARAFLSTGRRLDLLINNAGVMAIPERRMSREGLELQLATNHFGHFALTGLLLPALLKRNGNEESRVVTVSSIAHRGATMDFGDLQWVQNYKPWPAYRRSKLANLLFGLELGRRLADACAPVLSLIAHPGVSRTNLFRAGPGQKPGLIPKLIPLLIETMAQSEARGALPVLYAAVAGEVQEGRFYGPLGFRQMRGYPGEVRAEAQAYDQQLAEQLWKVSEEITGVRYDLPEPPNASRENTDHPSRRHRRPGHDRAGLRPGSGC